MKRLFLVLILLGCAVAAQAQGITVSQSVATSIMFGPFTVDGTTALTGYGPVSGTLFSISKNGGAFAASNDTTSCTADAVVANYCKKSFNATDMNTLGSWVAVIATTAGTTVRVEAHREVVAAASYAANVSGSLIAATDIVSAGPITTSGGKVSGVILVDTTTLTNTTTALTNMVFVATSGITSNSFAADAIDANAIAASAIGASEIAAGAINVSEAPNLDAAITTRLAPTVSLRTLDVTATGGAGIDWANVENPTSTVGLTNTTIATSQTIASVSGNVAGVTASVSVSSFTIPAIAQFFTANSLSSYAASVSGSVVKTIADSAGGSALTTNAIADRVWGYAIATFAGSAGSVSASLNAAGVAADPWTVALPGAYGAGTAGRILGRIPDIAVGSAGALLRAGTNTATTVNITGDLTGNVSGSVGSVAGNVSGNISGSVGSIATDGISALSFQSGAINATAIAADAIGSSELATTAIDEIWASVTTELAQGTPSATPAVKDAIMALYMALRNRVTVSTSTKTFSNDAGTVIFKKAVDDSITTPATLTEAEAVAGP